MGVRGLHSALEKKPLGKYKGKVNVEDVSCLHIDGASWCFHLYETFCEVRYDADGTIKREYWGGAFQKLHDILVRYVGILRDHDIELVVYRDEAVEIESCSPLDAMSEYFKSKTKQKRMQERLSKWLMLEQWCMQPQLECQAKELPLPPLTTRQYYSTLSQMGVEVINCQGEADYKIASDLDEVFVVGSDTDFLFYHTTRKISPKDLDQVFLSSDVFQHNNLPKTLPFWSMPCAFEALFKQKFENYELDRKRMYDLAILTGNDYTNQFSFHQILQAVGLGKIGPPSSHTIKSIVEWFKGKSKDWNLLDHAKDFGAVDKRPMAEDQKYAIAEYEERETIREVIELCYSMYGGSIMAYNTNKLSCNVVKRLRQKVIEQEEKEKEQARIAPLASRRKKDILALKMDILIPTLDEFLQNGAIYCDGPFQTVLDSMLIGGPEHAMAFRMLARMHFAQETVEDPILPKPEFYDLLVGQYYQVLLRLVSKSEEFPIGAPSSVFDGRRFHALVQAYRNRNFGTPKVSPFITEIMNRGPSPEVSNFQQEQRTPTKTNPTTNTSCQETSTPKSVQSKDSTSTKSKRKGKKKKTNSNQEPSQNGIQQGNEGNSASQQNRNDPLRTPKKSGKGIDSTPAKSKRKGKKSNSKRTPKPTDNVGQQGTPPAQGKSKVKSSKKKPRRNKIKSNVEVSREGSSVTFQAPIFDEDTEDDDVVVPHKTLLEPDEDLVDPYHTGFADPDDVGMDQATQEQENIAQPLPIDFHEDEIVREIEMNRVTIIQGETGCGKSSRLPFMLLRHAQEVGGAARVIISQPRRIACQGLFNRLSKDPQYGDKVGLRIGQGEKQGETQFASVKPFGDARLHSLVCCVTPGYLTRLLAHHEDSLQNMTHLIIDEIHERSLDTDLLCYLAKTLLEKQPNLRLVLMSATVQTGIYENYFGNVCPGSVSEPVFVGARRFPVDEYFCDSPLPGLSDATTRAALELSSKLTKGILELPNPGVIEKQYTLAVAIAQDIGIHGSAVLIFVAGMSDIENLVQRFENANKRGDVQFQVCPIHSEIPVDEQMKAFDAAQPGMVKVVIATNAAESSVTIPDIDCVICLGTCKELTYNPQSHRTMLQLQWISQSASIQRAGRTGRVRPGQVFRLYTSSLYQQMDESPRAEINQQPLDNLVLMMRTIWNDEPVAPVLQDMIEPPPMEYLDRAYKKLHQNNLVTERSDETAKTTSLGTFVSGLGIDPFIGRIIGLAVLLGVEKEAIVLAAVLTLGRSPFTSPNRMFHDPAEYNKMSQDVLMTQWKWDRGELMSEPLLTVRLTIAMEQAKQNKNYFKFVSSNHLSKVRAKQLLRMVSSVRKKTASMVSQLQRGSIAPTNRYSHMTVDKSMENQERKLSFGKNYDVFKIPTTTILLLRILLVWSAPDMLIAMNHYKGPNFVKFTRPDAVVAAFKARALAARDKNVAVKKGSANTPQNGKKKEAADELAHKASKNENAPAKKGSGKKSKKSPEEPTENGEKTQSEKDHGTESGETHTNSDGAGVAPNNTDGKNGVDLEMSSERKVNEKSSEIPSKRQEDEVLPVAAYCQNVTLHFGNKKNISKEDILHLFQMPRESDLLDSCTDAPFLTGSKLPQDFVHFVETERYQYIFSPQNKFLTRKNLLDFQSQYMEDLFPGSGAQCATCVYFSKSFKNSDEENCWEFDSEGRYFEWVKTIRIVIVGGMHSISPSSLRVLRELLPETDFEVGGRLVDRIDATMEYTEARQSVVKKIARDIKASIEATLLPMQALWWFATGLSISESTFSKMFGVGFKFTKQKMDSKQQLLFPVNLDRPATDFVNDGWVEDIRQCWPKLHIPHIGVQCLSAALERTSAGKNLKEKNIIHLARKPGGNQEASGDSALEMSVGISVPPWKREMDPNGQDGNVIFSNTLSLVRLAFIFPSASEGNDYLRLDDLREADSEQKLFEFVGTNQSLKETGEESSSSDDSSEYSFSDSSVDSISEPIEPFKIIAVCGTMLELKGGRARADNVTLLPPTGKSGNDWAIKALACCGGFSLDTSSHNLSTEEVRLCHSVELRLQYRDWDSTLSLDETLRDLVELLFKTTKD